MIWALIFSILISVMGGDSPLLLPNSNKLVKKYVVDREKQTKLLRLIKNVKKERKSFAKDDKNSQKILINSIKQEMLKKLNSMI